MAKMTIVCQCCGAEFSAYQYGGRKKFCSKQCLYSSGVSARHGESKTRLYNIWRGMKSRCLLASHPAYRYYGARGVAVCREWLENYESFRDWALSSGYGPSLELDRKDVNGNYDPDNCRWATRAQQMQNTRKRRNATTSKFKGVSKHSQQNKWVAQLHADGKATFVGSYKTQVEAALAYDDAASKQYGQYAKLNFPERKTGALR